MKRVGPGCCTHGAAKSTTIPRCARYQSCMAAGSFARKKTPPIPTAGIDAPLAKRAAPCSAALVSSQETVRASRGLLVLDHRRARADGDAAGLQRLGQLTLQADRQEAVCEVRLGDDHVLGQLEAALEVALGEAAVDETALGVVGGLAAGH